MSLYDRALATSIRLLATYGANVTLRKQTAGAYDPATSSATIINTDVVTKGALFDYTRMNYGQRLESGQTIQIGDKKLLLSPSGITADPVPNDLVIADGFTWTVIDVKILRPAGTTVLYELQLRK